MFLQAFEDIANRHELKIEQGDSFDDEGLLICGKCGGRKQARISIMGEERVVNCVCPCEQQRMEDEEREKLKRMWLRRIEHLKTAGFPDADMQKCTFENDRRAESRESRVCKRYAEGFKDTWKNGKGLLLMGNVGCGKTYYACAIANYVMEQGIPAIATNFSRIANTMQAHFEDRQAYLSSFLEYPLMIIDDLGVERKSEYMFEVVYNVIDDRYRAGMPMIITTNMPLEHIKKPAVIEQARIYDRILERCFPVEFKGGSMRRQIIRDEYEGQRQYLGYERE